MKAARVYWQHVILWTGGLVAVSLVFYAMARGSTHWRLSWIGMQSYATPYTAALLERIAAGMAIASLPAGMAASRHVLSWTEISKRALMQFALATLAATILVFALVGFVVPATARSEDPGPTPRLQARGNYYSFNELLSESARFHEQANIGAKPWEDGRTYNPSARWKAAALKQQFWFVIIWSLTPLIMAWIGVLIRLWTAITGPQQRALAEWTAALALLLTIQLTTSGFRGLQSMSWGASPLQAAGSGREIFFVSVLVLLTLIWTTTIARKHFRPLPG
jgi:type III secretory pathway component EscS